MAKYYKVKPEKHGTWCMVRWSDGSKTECVIHKDELLTVSEMKRFGISFDYVDEIEYSQKKVVFRHDYVCGKPDSKLHRYRPEDIPDYGLIRNPYRKEKKEPETLAQYLGRLLLPKR